MKSEKEGRKQAVEQMMKESGVQRREAEFIYALERGLTQGDVRTVVTEPRDNKGTNDRLSK